MGQSEPRASVAPASRRSRSRQALSRGCNEAATPNSTNRGRSSSGTVSMCSIRWAPCTSGPSEATVSRTWRTAASPMACVAVRTPALCRVPTAAAYACGSGQNASVPWPWQSGRSSQAVPPSTVPSMKNLAPPTAQCRPPLPCSSISSRRASSSAPGMHQGANRSRTGSTVSRATEATGSRSPPSITWAPVRPVTAIADSSSSSRARRTAHDGRGTTPASRSIAACSTR